MKLTAKAPPKGTVRDWLRSRANEGGTAFLFPEGHSNLSWQDVLIGAAKIASYLTANGVRKGESVAIVHPNSRQGVLCLFGVLYGGFRATMINLVAGSEAIGYALDHSDVRFAFVAKSARELFESASDQGQIEVLDSEDLVVVEPVELHELEPSDHALLMYTSGTTGHPKGVVHSHSSLLAGGWTVAIAHNLTSQDRGMCVLPIYHINGLCVTVIGALVSGGSLAMCTKFSASNFWRQIGASKSTWFSVVPTIISHLLHSDQNPEQSVKDRLRFGRSASSPLSPDVQAAFEARFDVPIIETMGLTETAAQILSNPLPPKIRKIGSPGIPVGNETAIFSKDFQPLKSDEEGEIVVRGPNVMLEYLKNPDATKECFTPNGWLRTGDLGRRDADGYFFVTGRLKELIIKGGENIAPREVDEALYSHSEVVEAAAFSRPSEVYGESVEAAVTISEGSQLTSKLLRELCVEKLGKFKSPDVVYILDNLPKGPSGKIQRLKLSEITG